MRLGFHYHIPAEPRGGEIWTPGYQSRFLDSLATHFEELVCFLHGPLGREKELVDSAVVQRNVRLVPIGPHVGVAKRLFFSGRYVQEFAREREMLDAVLLRGPSPLLPTFARAAGPLPVALLLVGSYVEGLASLAGPLWRRAFINVVARQNQRLQDRVATSSLVVVNSRKLRRYYDGRARALAEVRTTTLCETDFFERDDTCTNRPLRLLYAGRFDRAKGLLEIVDALGMLVNQGFDIVLDLVGWEDRSGGVVEEVAEAARRLGIADRVRNHGRKAVGPELFAFYQSADIFVLASQSHFEGFPRTIWEAMANSVPVVATRVGSIPDLLEDCRHAMLAPPRDSRALAGAIRRVIEDRELRKVMIRNGRELARGVTLERSAGEMASAIRCWIESRQQR